MDPVQSIKKRLKSVNNISQITKAMELVAATKMRRAQEISLASRPYAFAALELLARLSSQKNALPPLLSKRKIEKSAFVLITSDKGLAGSFNSSVIKKFEKHIKEKKIDIKNKAHSFIAIGEKAGAFLENQGFMVLKKFIRVGDYTSPEQTNPISDFLARGYLNKKWDEVILFSTYFKSALKQEVLARRVFPVDLDSIKETVKEIIPTTGRFAELLNPVRVYPYKKNNQDKQTPLEVNGSEEKYKANKPLTGQISNGVDSLKRPIIISDTGEFSLWLKPAEIGDIVGITMYKRVWSKELGVYFYAPFPPLFYWWKAQLIKVLYGKEVQCVELQTEPWGPALLYDLPLEEQKKTMDLEKFKYNIKFAQKTGLDTFYLWGVEWWYWMKTKHNDSSIWDEAKKLFFR